MTGQRGTGQWGPLESKPVGVYAPFTCYPGGQYRYERVEERRVALVAALVGVELGAYDRRIVGWFACDAVSTVATVVSLLRRARDTGGALIVAGELRRIAVEMDPRSGQPPDSPDPEPVNRTRSLWAHYLRARADELDPHGGGW